MDRSHGGPSALHPFACNQCSALESRKHKQIRFALAYPRYVWKQCNYASLCDVPYPSADSMRADYQVSLIQQKNAVAAIDPHTPLADAHACVPTTAGSGVLIRDLWRVWISLCALLPLASIGAVYC
eukprot:6199510-Pleurochrysis_carterae.AAC.1